eukprot:TRINITY_DN122161_c0_g1_i1.p1 TRINITY_DN122161_c0_g1~~TRINITY_DN122161_c0_g1_i1.p1  ORF type:complete len:945 (-),score=158.44 TRINITY_DN122161_c0_g1_i1:152-2986(-)
MAASSVGTVQDTSLGDVDVYCVLFVALACGLVVCKANREMRGWVAYTVIIFFLGVILGWMHELDADFGRLSRSIDIWLQCSSRTVLCVFLPCLLFSDAMCVSWDYASATIAQTALLAGPGVLFGTLLCGLVSQAPYGWNYSGGLCLGAIMFVTDPLAITRLLRKLGASKAVVAQLQGEALLGVAVAVSLWAMATAKMVGTSQGTGHALATFLQLCGGGVAAGLLVVGPLTALFLTRRGDASKRHNDIVQLAALVTSSYFAFYFGDQEAGISGLLATVMAAFVISRLGLSHVLDRSAVHTVLQTLEFASHSVVFFLAGVLCGRATLDIIEAADWAWLLFLYIFSMLIRAVVVAMLFPALRHCGLSTNWKEFPVLLVGGMRGAVGLSLAVAVASEARLDARTRQRVIFQASGLTVLSLLLNAGVCAVLCDKWGMAENFAAREELLAKVRMSLDEQLKEVYQRLSGDDFYALHSKELVAGWIAPLQDTKALGEELQPQEEQMPVAEDGVTSGLACTAAPPVADDDEGQDGQTTADGETDSRASKKSAMVLPPPRPQAAQLPPKAFATWPLTGTPSLSDPAPLTLPNVVRGGLLPAGISLAELHLDHACWHSQDGANKAASGGSSPFSPLRNAPNDATGQKKEGLSTVRQMFYGMLRAEYAKQMEEGKLPRHQRSAYLVMGMVERADLTPHVPLCDAVQLLRALSYATGWRLPHSVVRLWRDIWFATLAGKYYVPVRRGNAVFDCLSVVSVMDAHVAAQKKISDFDWSGSVMLRDVIAAVICESHAQVRLMKRFLEVNRVNNQLLSLVRSQQLARAVLKETKRRVKTWRSTGVLRHSEAAEMLEEIAEDQIRTWAGGSLHPTSSGSGSGENWWTAHDAEMPLQLPPEASLDQLSSDWSSISPMAQGDERDAVYESQAAYKGTDPTRLPGGATVFGRRLSGAEQEFDRE